MAHENVLTLHCALSDRFQKMHLTLALYAMHMTQLESIEYKFGNKALLFYCTLLKTCQVHKSVQMYKILIQRNDIYSSLFCRNKTRKDIYALIIRTVNCEKI